MRCSRSRNPVRAGVLAVSRIGKSGGPSGFGDSDDSPINFSMKFIQLTRGYAAIVDDADYERVVAAGPWHAVVVKKTGIVYAKHNGYVKGSKPLASAMHTHVTT
jgi:hypothetical protein